MRNLATIRKITSIEPIKGKDRVELAHVDGWTCMVSKADNFKKGDLCIFCETDSVFPKKEEWAFLEKYNYRIKTQRYKDSDDNYIYSQGLALPLSVLPKSLKVINGLDVTDILGITKYEPQPPDEPCIESKRKKRFLERLPFMRYAWYRKLIGFKRKDNSFPSFVSKTDEERIQNCPNIIEKPTSWAATEKIDGQSGTFAVVRHRRFIFNKYEFIVCSRNLRRPYPDDSSYWQMARKYNIKNKLVKYIKSHGGLEWVVIQGECVGPKIQGNKYHLKENDLYVFNFITSNVGRFSSYHAQAIIEDNFKMKFVPLLGIYSLKERSVEEILKIANGKSKLYDTLREGIVFRSAGGEMSFKAVSPEFLVKYGE